MKANDTRAKGMVFNQKAGEYIQELEADLRTSINLREQTDMQLARTQNLLGKKVAELKQRIHDAYEVYAGMDGVMPESDKEVYLMRCITQMARELEKGE